MPRREFWFADGPGRAAILAREAGDHQSAKIHLDRLLARGDLSPEARAGGYYLRALEDLAEGRHADAAERLGRAREGGILGDLEPELAMLHARAYLDAGRPERALEVMENGPPHPKLKLMRAAAYVQRGDLAKALEMYEAVAHDDAAAEPTRTEAQLDLALLLVNQSDPAAKGRAEALFEEVVAKATDESAKAQASQALERLRGPRTDTKATSEDNNQRATAHAQEHLLLDAERELRRRNYTTVLRAMDRLLRKPSKLAAQVQCQAHYLKGSALFKLRRRADSTPAFERSAEACKKADDVETEIKSRFQGARGRYAQGNYETSAKAMESLAADHAKHSMADDALIKAGEAWESHGDLKAAKGSYRRALALSGDMAEEARRRLVLLAFVEREPQEVVRLVEEFFASGAVDGAEKPRLVYYRGRAYQRLDRIADAQQDFLEVLRLRPLSYSGLLALSRLREISRDALEQGISRLVHASPQQVAEIELPDDEYGRKIRMYARLGLANETFALIREAKLDGWPAIAALVQAGHWWESQRRIAQMTSAWRHQPPVGPARKLWEMAHPVPYFDLVGPQEQKMQLSPFLTYAIMQTESRFDPTQVSWAGAIGLMQLMPGTASGVAKDLGVIVSRSALREAKTNLALGMHYLSQLVSRWGDQGSEALAVPSYNAGAGSVDRWLKERGDWDLDLFIEAIPFDETRNYTQSVLGRWWTYRWLYGQGTALERLPYLPLAIPQRRGKESNDEMAKREE